MARRTTALLSLAVPASAGAVSSQSVAGVQKVIEMLADMTAKAMQEKKDEQVAFAEFTTWCSQESTNLASSIKKSSEKIEMLTASIGQLGSEISTLGDDIAQLQADETKFQSEKEATLNQRAKDKASFQAEEQDFSESVDAIERALVILSKQDYDRPAAAAALVQVSSVQQLPDKARSIVSAFVGLLDGDKKDPMDYSAPEANAYEFQSGGIVAILKKLRDEFRSKLADAQKEEMNSQHASDMIVMDLTDAIENAQADAARRTQKKEQKSEKKALEEKQLKGTIAVKAADSTTLSETKTECKEKSLSFEEKQQLRMEEIEALQKATEILSSPDVSGNAEKYLALAQVHTKVALLQAAGGSSEHNQGVHRRIRDFLSSEGERLHSQGLTLLAQKIMADPFAKVKKMIDGMITRLTEEANEDAKHEGFCDEEMGKSKITRNKLSSDIDGLSASIDDGKATIMSLTEETAQLSSDVAGLEKAMSEATELRAKEKATNAATVKDAQAAQTAVAAATAVLKDFYAKASTATGFLQAPSPREWGLKTGVKMGTDEWDALANPNFKGQIDKGHKEDMQTFGETAKGQQDEAQYGVLGLLEVIASDFATVEANTKAAEAAAAEAYERFMVDSKRSVATKTRKVELNQADKAAADAKVQEETADLKSTQDQLLAAERYHERLVPQCIDRGMTWEQRVAARQAEIDSLKEALKILGSSDVA